MTNIRGQNYNPLIQNLKKTLLIKKTGGLDYNSRDVPPAQFSSPPSLCKIKEKIKKEGEK